MDVSPASGSTHIGIAEPDEPFKRLALIDTFHPQFRSHHCGVAPNSDSLIGVPLVLVLHPASARPLKQVRFGISLTRAQYDDEIVSKDAIHGGSVVILDGRLILAIEGRDGLFVACGATASNDR